MKINNRTYPGLNRIIQQYNLPVFAFSDNFINLGFNKASVIHSKMNESDFDEALDNVISSRSNGIYLLNQMIFVYKNNDNDLIDNLLFNKDGISAESQSEELKKWLWNSFFRVLIFKEYAEIETKILPPKTESNDGIKCVYSNHSKFPITFIDSTWFTNLVKSDAFKVSGHFRLQPCHDENGMPTKKLIWIKDFMKSGYTAPARKIANS